MLISEALTLITTTLAAAGIEEPRREARLLLAAALNTDATGLLKHTEIDQARFTPLLARRAAREPLAYLTGRREFWGLEFAVSPATLIPRPDSETLIEAALENFKNRDSVKSILDLGTGTGCLLIAALHEFPRAFGVGVDISPAAAALARQNAKNLNANAAILAGSWAGALAGRFDLILSNPPYITAADIKTLMPEVQNYEPNSALDGGADGLNAYRAIITMLPDLLQRGGAAILELGAGQAGDIAQLAAAMGLQTQFRDDLAGIARAAIIRYP
jgi:release factor glutamine methyltransferase